MVGLVELAEHVEEARALNEEQCLARRIFGGDCEDVGPVEVPVCPLAVGVVEGQRGGVGVESELLSRTTPGGQELVGLREADLRSSEVACEAPGIGAGDVAVDQGIVAVAAKLRGQHRSGEEGELGEIVAGSGSVDGRARERSRSDLMISG